MSSATRSFSNLTGLVLSIACVIHCMLMPLLIASLPEWGLAWLTRPVFHQTLALTGIAIGVWTLVPGWKQHRRHTVLAFGVLGLVIMNYVAFFSENCCAAEAQAGDSGGSSCIRSCCAVGAESFASPELQHSDFSAGQAITTPSRIGTSIETSQAASGLRQWTWLFQHPTAWGAALPAWAHCLNGACTKACCQRRNDTSAEERTCNNTSLVSGAALVQLGKTIS